MLTSRIVRLVAIEDEMLAGVERRAGEIRLESGK